MFDPITAFLVVLAVTAAASGAKQAYQERQQEQERAQRHAELGEYFEAELEGVPMVFLPCELEEAQSPAPSIELLRRAARRAQWLKKG